MLLGASLAWIKTVGYEASQTGSEASKRAPRLRVAKKRSNFRRSLSLLLWRRGEGCVWGRFRVYVCWRVSLWCVCGYALRDRTLKSQTFYKNFFIHLPTVIHVPKKRESLEQCLDSHEKRTFCQKFRLVPIRRSNTYRWREIACVQWPCEVRKLTCDWWAHEACEAGV